MSDHRERLHNHRALRERRKQLRRQMTPAEARLWTVLRRRQLEERKFRRQHSIGPYVVDFYCVKEGLAVEVDGSIHDDPARSDYDAKRQAFLERQGIVVLRFKNEQIRDRLPEVLVQIASHFQD